MPNQNKELKKIVDKLDAEIMYWHYEVCRINFNVEDYIQDSSDLRNILKDFIIQDRLNLIQQIIGMISESLKQELHRHNSIPSYTADLDEGCIICLKNKTLGDIEEDLKSKLTKLIE